MRARFQGKALRWYQRHFWAHSLRIVKLRPDPEHPLSRGYACPKGIAMGEVQNDPDRVTHPLRRTSS